LLQPAQHRTQRSAVRNRGKCHHVLQEGEGEPAGLWRQRSEHVANEPEVARPVPGAAEAAAREATCQYVVG
jgi:hypothetical protein